MNALVIYETLTGNTRTAANLIAAEMVEQGINTSVCSRNHIDYQKLADADVVIVGSWVDGLVFAGQKPGRSSQLKKLPRLDGKLGYVFCTYAVHPGSTLTKMTDIVSELGATVVGGMAIKRSDAQTQAEKMASEISSQLVGA